MFFKCYKKIDALGRVQIPKEFRRELELGENDDILIEISDGRIVISKAVQNCVFCGKSDGLTEFHDKFVCKNCIKILNTT